MGATTGATTIAAPAGTAATRVPRLLHAGAWWAWALALAIAATRTTNPALLGLVVAVLAIVVAARSSTGPWRGAFRYALVLGAVVIAVRVVFQALFGGSLGSTVILTLPEVPLPAWLSGIRLGGPVTAEALLGAAYEGMRLATVIACVGAAISLASPIRLLRSAPAALYEMGLSLVVAMSFAPQLVGDLERVRQARRLRGRRTRGPRGLAEAAMPVLEGALDRSITLAAAMASRGYGRTARPGTGTPTRPMRAPVAAIALVGSLAALLVGTYGLLDATAPPILGLPLVAIGIAGAIAGLAVAGRRSIRTRYRRDPWTGAEWATLGCGLLAAVVTTAVAIADPSALAGPLQPPGWPALPPLPAAAIALAALPALVTPPVPAAGGARLRIAEPVPA